MCFVFLYLHLFSATEHVSHVKALYKYAHYYYYCYTDSHATHGSLLRNESGKQVNTPQQQNGNGKGLGTLPKQKTLAGL